LSSPPPTTAYRSLSLHDALPICGDQFLLEQDAFVGPHRFLQRGDPDNRVAAGSDRRRTRPGEGVFDPVPGLVQVADPFEGERPVDRKSTRLNSSHVKISYAVFCL